MKNNILSCINPDLPLEQTVNTIRVKILNSSKIGEENVVYLINREFRAKDNFGLMFAQKFAADLSKDLLVVISDNTNSVILKNEFINRQKNYLKRDLELLNIPFQEDLNVQEFVNSSKFALMITDFNPINSIDFSYVKNPVYIVDSHNIVPAWFASDKKEYNATSFRRKLQGKIWDFLTEFPKNNLPLNEADLALNKFINEKLENYSNFKNNPLKNATSNLSKYLNLGFIAPQRVALEIFKSNVKDEQKEAFLEELIVRSELSDNFCLYANDYKSYDDAPTWAKNTIFFHRNDLREYEYSLADFEQAKTHDRLWNAAQKQLLKEGKTHGYLRMYWAKKIFEWSKSFEEALETAIYLNDKYAFDAPSSNGYVGILWSMAALHDRPFRERAVTGKIRTMTFNGAKSKFDVEKYINQFN